MAARGDEDVRGLDVAMDDVAAVRGIEPIDDLNRKIERLFRRERLCR